MLSRLVFPDEQLLFPMVLFISKVTTLTQSCWMKKVLEIISKGGVKGLAHITGGGFTDNIPRVFPKGLGAKIFTGSWKVLPVFNWLQQVILDYLVHKLSLNIPGQ
jgi:phosphoribosylaminoimidazole (AIR) synthetase